MPRCPLTSHLELGARPAAVPCARMITKQVVREWGLPDLAETAELLVSELVTNAIRASCGLPEPAIRLWLVSDRSTLVIRVWDGSSEMPAVCQDATSAMPGPAGPTRPAPAVSGDHSRNRRQLRLFSQR